MKNNKEYLHNVILGYEINKKTKKPYKKIAMNFPLLNDEIKLMFEKTWSELLNKTNNNNNNFSIYHLSSRGITWKQFIKDNPYFSSIKKPITNIEEFVSLITPSEITSIDIANLILKNEYTNNCTHLRLQLILYLCFQNYYQTTKKHLFVDYEFEMFNNHPINKQIFKKYKKYKNKTIKKSLVELKNANLKIYSHNDYLEIIKCVCSTIRKYNSFTNVELINFINNKNIN